MNIVTISPKFEVTIPPQLIEELNLISGMQLHIFKYGNGIKCTPLREIKNMRGFLKGMNTNMERKSDRL